MNADTLIVNYLNDNNKNPNIKFVRKPRVTVAIFTINEIIADCKLESSFRNINLDELLESVNDAYLDFEKFINIITRIKNMICKCIHVLLQIVI